MSKDHKSLHFRFQPKLRLAPSLLRTAGIGAIGSLLFASNAQAQEDGEVIAQQVTLKDQLLDAGMWMVPLYLLLIIVVALYIYNALQLSKNKFCPAGLKNSLMDHMGACRVRSAIEAASESPSYLGRMAAISLPHVDADDQENFGREKVEDAMAEFTTRENRGYLNWIGYFSIISQAAPMLGLLGTVVGMIKAFGTLEQTGAADPSQLAGSISLALFTTAAGLIVAIPAIFGFFFYRNKMNKLVAFVYGITQVSCCGLPGASRFGDGYVSDDRHGFLAAHFLHGQRHHDRQQHGPSG